MLNDPFKFNWWSHLVLAHLLPTISLLFQANLAVKLVEPTQLKLQEKECLHPCLVVRQDKQNQLWRLTFTKLMHLIISWLGHGNFYRTIS